MLCPSQTIGILDANLGNLRSLSNAIYNLGYDFRVVSHPREFETLTHLIIPGVGSYRYAMESLERLELCDPIRNHVNSGKPLLGICLGMQVLGTWGAEVQQTEGLGLLSGGVIRFPNASGFQVPHVGWNSVRMMRHHPVFEGIKDDADFYFVHSYFLTPSTSESIYGITDYGMEFCSVAGDRNVIAFQFHPEKSQTNGLRLLSNFCDWNGAC